jgi:hypothetical protein
MDTALADGDFSPGANGFPRRISGAEELFQRAAIRLTIPRGSFRYDPSLGSRLHTLTGEEEDPDAAAFSLVQEALCTLPEITAESAEYTASPEPTVKIKLLCRGEEKMIEVKL